MRRPCVRSKGDRVPCFLWISPCLVIIVASYNKVYTAGVSAAIARKGFIFCLSFMSTHAHVLLKHVARHAVTRLRLTLSACSLARVLAALFNAGLIFCHSYVAAPTACIDC